MKPGDKAKILKRTFLNQGIFVHTNSTVEILEINSEKIKTKYLDKEGFPHEIEFLPNELELLT
ncbi:hypothetical protein [Leptospira sp. GIMC2001]|uniref:hypothetical protein n=1 Tax=Leptospira sp. GIMC2001 TaxID=1513297 RepID=UPI0023493A27|nr:hypothetical protein [Leptospira sp. GIMC2001]WCL50865.1 hypothetical protein O4O04_08645 [Leptospira sp. GIMC2001]